MTLPAHGLGLCVQCRQPIRWTVTAARQRLAVNPEVDATGNTVAYLDGHGVWRSRRPTSELPQETYEHLFTPHVATCLYGPAQVAEHRLPDGVSSLAARRRARSRGGAR
jgi:hypothetical protein